MDKKWDRFQILDAIHQVVYISDMDTYEIIYVNKKCRDMLGMTMKEIQQKKCYEVFQREKKICHFCTNERLKKEETTIWLHENRELDSVDLLHDSVIEIDGKRYRMELAVDISQTNTDAVKIRKALEAEKWLSDCIQDLVITSNHHEAVKTVINKVLDYYKGDRAYIFEFDWKKNITQNTYETCAEGVIPEIDSLQNVDIEVLDLWLKIFNQGKDVNIPYLDDIKDDPKRLDEYELLKRQNISSLMAVPFWYDHTLQGFLGVDNPTDHLDTIDFLKQLSYFITNEIENNKLTQKLEYLSYNDVLTKCFNRNAYTEKLQTLKNWNTQYNAIGIAFVDMNGLKYINDTYGHSYGDEIICKLAQILKEYFEDEDIFRISGDEFVIVSVNNSYQDFVERASALQNRLIIEERDLASIGYIWENSDVEIETLVQQAEMRMYTIKKEYHANRSKEGKQHRPRYMDQLLQELSSSDLLVYLQPKYDVAKEEVSAAEALVRKRDSDGNIMVPFEFIHVLENENMISAVDYFVFEEVCKMLVRWQKEGRKKMIVSTNFSRVTLAENGFAERIEEICRKTKVDCNSLVLEITESSNAVHVEQMSDTLQKLKKIGLRFAIDDVGTEYSTLAMVTLPELDIAKLDRSLIMRIADSERDRVLVEKLIELSHTLGMVCIAEGVETEKQFEILKKANCDRIQGYLIGRPMLVEKFEKIYM